MQRILASKGDLLAELMKAAWEGGPPNTAIQLAGLLRDEFVRPLGQVLNLGVASASVLESSRPAQGTNGLQEREGEGILVDALFQPSTSLEELRAIKETYKRRRGVSRTPSDAAINSTIYYTAIAAALVYQGIRITELAPDALCQAFRWMLNQPWMDQQCQELAMAALRIVSPKT